MKRVDSKVVVATVATVFMVALSPSVSFARSDETSVSGLFQNSDLDFTEIRREPQCCAMCEDEETLSSEALSGAGRLGGGKGAPATTLPQSHNNYDNSHDNDQQILRILTWSGLKKELEAHADLYKKSKPGAPTVRIVDVPSLKELDYEVASELRLGSTLFDGFIVPPLMMGNMLRPRSGQALAIWTEDEIEGFDLLPYYRYNVATYGGRLRGLPILSGSQGLILFRKDYLDALNLPTPKTWEEWTTMASVFLEQNDRLLDVWPNENYDYLYGACLGLLNEAGCRRRNSLGDSSCKSQTMTYLGMVMASMTQYGGNSTGYMMGMHGTSGNDLDPLFEPTLKTALKWMEQQVENSSPDSLKEDSIESMKHFRNGRCAWTISVDHDEDFLADDNIGFVPLPGSHQVLDRGAPGKGEFIRIRAPDSVTNCTASFCPYGKDILNRGRVNHVPFGAVDATIGTVSALISRDRQEETKNFFKFILSSETLQDDTMQQPLTYTGLKKSRIPNYKETIVSLTISPNSAIPIRVPNAFNLLSDLDDRIYDYLTGGEYSDDKREQVALAAEKSWNAIISMYDFRRPQNKQSTSMFYELSLGQYVPPVAPHLYVGWIARGVMWILAGLSCLGSVLAAMWVWKYQEERVIRASQPVFLYLICAGTFVMASSVFTLGVEDDIASTELTSAICMANYWLYSIGFTAVISALFSKMWMLGQVFQKPRNEQRIQITKQNILLPFFFIFGLDCLVLSIWTIFDRQVWVRVPINIDDPYSPTIGWCMSDNSVWFTGMLFVFNIGILFLSLVQSYECRRITTEYAESSWVTIAIATTAQAWFIGLPLLLLIDSNPTLWFVLISSTVLCTTIPILLLIFVPKMRYSYEALKNATVRLSVEEARKKLFVESMERSGELRTSSDFISTDFTSAGSVGSTRGSSQHSTPFRRQQDPKGTIGIRIIQCTYLDRDEVEELEDEVEFAEQRNKELKTTMGRLKDNIEEHHVVRKHMFRSAPRYSTKSKTTHSKVKTKTNKSDNASIITGDIGSILEAKPSSRHSKLSRREQYLA